MAAQIDSLTVAVDETSVLTERDIDKNLSEKYNGEDFNYDVKTGESANLLQRFIIWFQNFLRDNFGIDISPSTMLFLEYLIYVLMGVLVLYLLIRMFTNEKFSAIFSKKAKSIIDIDLTEQHIESIELDALMADALSKKDYRLAVRYQFLKILRHLSQKDIIDWHFDKTNSDYEKEIKHAPLQQAFKKAAYLYENIWYGEQPIDEAIYAQTDSRFTALKNLIQR